MTEFAKEPSALRRRPSVLTLINATNRDKNYNCTDKTLESVSATGRSLRSPAASLAALVRRYRDSTHGAFEFRKYQEMVAGVYNTILPVALSTSPNEAGGGPVVVCPVKVRVKVPSKTTRT